MKPVLMGSKKCRHYPQSFFELKSRISKKQFEIRKSACSSISSATTILATTLHTTQLIESFYSSAKPFLDTAGSVSQDIGMVGKKWRSRCFQLLSLEVPHHLADRLATVLWEEGTLGVEESADQNSDKSLLYKVYFQTKSELRRCHDRIMMEVPGVKIVIVGSVCIDDWVSLLHGGFETVAVGPLLIVPAAAPQPLPPGATLLKINPGLGFGTGTHPTTRLCLEFLCERLRPGLSVLDVGTGSGILAVAAALLGAPRVLAVDIDPDALENAAGNLKINGVADKVELRPGSIEQAVGRTFDLVLANILAVTVIELLQQGLGRLVAVGGEIVLSGFAPEENERVAYALGAQGFGVSEIRTSGQWAALLAERPG